jgi:hypothetical protein
LTSTERLSEGLAISASITDFSGTEYFRPQKRKHDRVKAIEAQTDDARKMCRSSYTPLRTGQLATSKAHIDTIPYGLTGAMSARRQDGRNQVNFSRLETD